MALQAEDREELIERLYELRLEVSRRVCSKLHGFVKEAWRIIEPDTPFVSNWHIEELCNVLERVTVKDPDYLRVIINVPPGTMKSLLVSVFWPAFVWSKTPGKRFFAASYAAALSTRDNVRLRQLLTSQWFNERFGEFEFEEDQNAKNRFNTTKGGWRIASSVNGVITGEHPDYIVIDDPLSAMQAVSVADRRNANDWVDKAISTRGISRDVATVVVMQRLHEEDVTGHLKARGGWRVICFPMRFEVSRKNDASYQADPRDHRTVPGELLWPELFTEAKVKLLERALGSFDVACQLQQNPSPEEGGLFKRENWRFVGTVAKARVVRSVRGWDTAGTDGGGDYTVGHLLHEMDDETYVVENVIREQLGPAGVDKTMRLTAELDGAEVAQREEKEGGSAGLAVIAMRVRSLKGFDYAGAAVSTDKVTRSKAYRTQQEAGNVYLLLTGDPVKDAWIKPYIDELANFPNGKHDDQVDGASCSFNQLMLEPPRIRSLTWGR